MNKRAGKFQLLNETQRLCVLGRLTKSKKFRTKKFRSKFYHPNPSKVRTEIKENIKIFNKNFKAFSKDLSLLRDLWKDKKSINKMYELLADFYMGRIFDWKFNDALYKKRLEFSKILQQPNTFTFEEFTQPNNQERLQKLMQKLINDPKTKENLEWLRKPDNEEYHKLIDKLIKEGFLTEWELEQEGYTKNKISKMFRILRKRDIVTNPNKKAWNHIQKKYLTPFKTKRLSYGMATPVFNQNRVWIFTPYGSIFSIILQSKKIKQDIMENTFYFLETLLYQT